jgi:hypothetical protein
MRRVLFACLLVAGAARADMPIDPVTEPSRLEVAVGETVQRDVGFALGLVCDDLAIVRADLRTAASGSNVFEVTGVQLGDTTCRAGTTPNRPTYLFAIRVVPPRPPPSRAPRRAACAYSASR